MSDNEDQESLNGDGGEEVFFLSKLRYSLQLRGIIVLFQVDRVEEEAQDDDDSDYGGSSKKKKRGNQSPLIYSTSIPLSP